MGGGSFQWVCKRLGEAMPDAAGGFHRHSALYDAERLRAMRAAPLALALAAEGELVRDEANDRVTRSRLRAALSAGGVVGDVHHADMGAPALAPLKRAISHAERYERPGDRTSATTRALCASAHAVLSARRLVRARRWDELDARALAAAVDAHATAPDLARDDAACRELTLIRRVCAARRAAAALRAAIATGAVTGTPGALALDGVAASLPAIDRALADAERLEPEAKSSAITALCAAASAVRALRAAAVPYWNNKALASAIDRARELEQKPIAARTALSAGLPLAPTDDVDDAEDDGMDSAEEAERERAAAAT